MDYLVPHAYRMHQPFMLKQWIWSSVVALVLANCVVFGGIDVLTSIFVITFTPRIELLLQIIAPIITIGLFTVVQAWFITSHLIARQHWIIASLIGTNIGALSWLGFSLDNSIAWKIEWQAHQAIIIMLSTGLMQAIILRQHRELAWAWIVGCGLNAVFVWQFNPFSEINRLGNDLLLKIVFDLWIWVAWIILAGYLLRWYQRKSGA